MNTEKRRQGRSVAKVMLVALATVLLAWPVLGTAKEQTTWTWSEENPQPVWWHWGKEYESQKPVRGGYFRSAVSQYIGLMNPNHWPVNDWRAMSQMYEKLFYNGGEFRPTVNWLVGSWKYTGPRTAVMKLRKGVKFHDGSDFSAHSYKYQLDWIKHKGNGAWSRAWVAPVKKLEVIDTYTLKWTFKKQWAAFPGIMANVPGYAISAKALKADVALAKAEKLEKQIAGVKRKIDRLAKKSGRKTAKKIAKAKRKLAGKEKQLAQAEAESAGATPLDKKAVGTGRFMLEEGRPGNYLKLKRNPNWWFGQSIGRPDMPYFDGQMIKVIPDISVQLANLRAGKLDTLVIDTSQYSLVRHDKSLNISKVPQNHMAGYNFNHSKGAAKDIRVRKAISHAIDRRALIFGTQFGLGIEASCVYNRQHWAHNPELKPVKYDPELSRKLLAEAGYSNGLTITGYSSNIAYAKPVASAIKNMLGKVGISWEHDFLDPVAMDDRLKNLEFDFAIGGWTWIWDPDLLATGQYHPDGGFNNGRTNNKEVIALIEAGRKELDVKKRQQIYWKMEEILYNNYEDVWLYWPISVTARSKNVRGYNMDMYIQGREGYWFSHPRWFKNGHP
ncbi:MAG: ABC transporter substrate-binding protein [Proteobacteria bacterium]|nr:ABC transporter substrate-binding protein [Pseudomonadota bacterium]